MLTLHMKPEDVRATLQYNSCKTAAACSARGGQPDMGLGLPAQGCMSGVALCIAIQD